MDDGAAIVGGDFDGGVEAAGGGAADEEGCGEALALHFLGVVDHFVEGGGDEAAESDVVGADFAGAAQDGVAVDHDAEVFDFVAVAAEDDGDDVFADVVDVAFDCGDEEGACASAFAGGFFGFHKGGEVGDGAFHDAGAFDDLGEEHFAVAKELADDFHAVHEWAFDDVEWAAEGEAGLFGVLVDVVGDAFDEGVFEAFGDGPGAPFLFGGSGVFFAAGGGFDAFGEVEEAFGGVVAAVEEDVLNVFAQFGVDVVVDLEHAGVDDAHVEAGGACVVEEDGVHGFAHGVVAAEGEGNVADAAAGAHAGAGGFDFAHGFDEVEGIGAVFFDACGDGEDVEVEDDVFGGEVDFFGEEAVGALGDGDFICACGGLAFFVEGHDDDGGTIAADEFGLVEEFFFAFFEGDGVDDAFALEAFEAFFEDVPFGAVDHDGDAGDVGLGGDEVEEAAHAGAGVEHAFVEVHVDDVGAVGDLLAGDFDSFVEFVFFDEFAEAGGTGDVVAFADEGE